MFIIGLNSKKSFSFYTSITGWENLKYLYRVCFQKFRGLLCKSSVSKSNTKEWELNQRKIRHGLCWKHGQLQKPLSFFINLSPSGICRRGFLAYFFSSPHFIFVLCESWCVGHIQSLLEDVLQFVEKIYSQMSV